MPLLEYRCGECEKKTEELVLAGDAPVAPSCSACGSPNVTRLLSAFAAHSHSHSGADALPCGAGDPSACGMQGGGCGTGGGCGAMDGGGWDA